MTSTMADFGCNPPTYQIANQGIKIYVFAVDIKHSAFKLTLNNQYFIHNVCLVSFVEFNNRLLTG